VITLLQEFLKAIFLEVDLESLLGEATVWSRQNRVMVRKGHNFGSDRLIAIKILYEFPEALFNGMDVESILGKAEVWSHQTGVSEGRFPWIICGITTQ
jgi:hypothetical protein